MGAAGFLQGKQQEQRGQIENRAEDEGGVIAFGGIVHIARDERAESDLTEQGVGPRGLRAELRVRLALASAVGVTIGLGIAMLLTRRCSYSPIMANGAAIMDWWKNGPALATMC